MASEYAVLLSLAVTTILSGNNVAVCVGPVVGSGIMREKTALLTAGLAFSLGLVLYGWKLEKYVGIQGESVIALSIALLMLLLGEFLKIPMSLVYVTATTYLTLAFLRTGSEVYIYSLLSCIGYWVLTIVLCALIAPLLLLLLARIGRRSPLLAHEVNRCVALILTFILCFIFGANNIGFLWALAGGSILTLPAYVIATVLGISLLGQRILRKLSYIYVLSPASALAVIAASLAVSEIATELGIPVSFSVAMISSLLGLSLAYRVRILDYKYLVRVYMWTYGTIPLTAGLAVLVANLLKLC